MNGGEESSGSGALSLLVIVVIGLIIWISVQSERVAELEGRVSEQEQQITDLEDENGELRNKIDCAEFAMPFSGSDYYELWDAINEIESCLL